jgi:hypothetical protein
MWLRTSRNRGLFWLSCWFAFPLLNAVLFYGLALLADSIASATWIVSGLLLLESSGLYGFVRGFTRPERRARWVLGGTAILVCVTFLALIAAYWLVILTFYGDQLA